MSQCRGLPQNDKMKFFVCVAFTVFVCWADDTLPKNNKGLIIKREYFTEDFLIYTAEHEVVSVVAPRNALNFNEEDNAEVKEEDFDVSIERNESDTTLFFALADIGTNGERLDKGLYILKNKIATKLLDNGRDTTAELGESKVVYFGASDGIYKYNAEENKAEKYGSINDSILRLLKVNSSDIIYILTDNNQLYKVTEEGTKKSGINGVTSAKDIAIDNSENLFYIGVDNKPYVVTVDGVREIIGFSHDSTYTKLIRPPFLFIEKGVLYASSDKVYMIYPNGTSFLTDFVLRAKPSAYDVETLHVQYYGYDKKIYEYKILDLLFGSFIPEITEYLHNNLGTQKVGTRSRKNIKP